MSDVVLFPVVQISPIFFNQVLMRIDPSFFHSNPQFANSFARAGRDQSLKLFFKPNLDCFPFGSSVVSVFGVECGVPLVSGSSYPRLRRIGLFLRDQSHLRLF